jgi:UDP-4-amino-4-deoxy-L-arabinose formyltransferase/UDP-glucuronic acid dehydrogenase (UDP-4-keto-hexauronic acid decarboxylating)
LYAGLRRLPRALELAIVEDIPGRAQEGEGSYFPRELPEEGSINPEWDDARIDRFIRAMYFPPFEPATLKLEDQKHKIVTFEQYNQLMDNE